MFNTQSIESTDAKPVVEQQDKEIVADERTNKDDTGNGDNTGGDNQTDAEKETARLEAEKNARKEAALAEGKTEDEFEAAEKLALENAGKTADQLAEEKRIADEKVAQDASIEAIRKEERAKFLKEMGVESEDELKAKLNPTKPKTPEELAAEANIYNASLAKFAVENKVFTNDEWLAVQNMRKAPDADLVFQNFAHEYKEQNKDRKLGDAADPVTDEEIKDKFNELYHVDSDNKALKEQGEKNLALKAQSIRGPLETKFNDIKEIYDTEIAEKQAVPEFRKFFQGILATSIPDKLEYGKGDDKVVFDLSTLDKAELEQFLVKEIGNREFSDFLKGKGTPEQRARIQKEITKELLYRNHENIATENFKAGLSKGTKAGAAGSKVPFKEPEKREQQQASVKITPQDNAKIAKDFA